MPKRPRIEGYAVISTEGMIATSDGSFPESIKIPADHEFYQDAVDRASAVANGAHSAEGGPKERERKRLRLTRRNTRLMPDPNNPHVIFWNPAMASFDEAWQRLGIGDGVLAVVGGTDVFGLFLGIGIKLVDFKIEFGRLYENDMMRIVLADEISPDNCRLWDVTTNEKLDKDRFRRDLGGVVEAYSEVAKRLGIMPESVQGENKGPVLVQYPVIAARAAIQLSRSTMKVRVFITLKNGVLDPQGKAIGHALNGLGFGSVGEVRQGKVIDLDLSETDADKAKAELKAMCEKLLANTVIEKYEIELKG